MSLKVWDRLRTPTYFKSTYTSQYCSVVEKFRISINLALKCTAIEHLYYVTSYPCYISSRNFNRQLYFCVLSLMAGGVGVCGGVCGGV